MVERIINNQRTSTRNFEDLYPFDSQFLNIGGHELHYLDHGQGKPLLMVHGNPTWSFYFNHQIRELGKYYRCIVPDHIGCGFSDKPDVSEYQYTLRSRVCDLDALINHLDLDEKINLLIHDWGGMIGLAWAIDRLDLVDKIIITNTSGFFLPKDKSLPVRLWLIKYMTWFAIPAVLGLNIFSRAALFMATAKGLPPKIRKGLVEPYNSWKNRIATLKFVQDIPISEKDESYAIVDHVDRHLNRLDDNQLLFLWGKKDFVFDLSFFNEFRRRFPNAQSKVFHSAGHYLLLDKPEETCRMIKEFIDNS